MLHCEVLQLPHSIGCGVACQVGKMAKDIGDDNP